MKESFGWPDSRGRRSNSPSWHGDPGSGAQGRPDAPWGSNPHRNDPSIQPTPSLCRKSSTSIRHTCPGVPCSGRCSELSLDLTLSSQRVAADPGSSFRGQIWQRNPRGQFREDDTLFFPSSRKREQTSPEIHSTKGFPWSIASKIGNTKCPQQVLDSIICPQN